MSCDVNLVDSWVASCACVQLIEAMVAIHYRTDVEPISRPADKKRAMVPMQRGFGGGDGAEVSRSGLARHRCA
jgi:hypothetical protein